MNFGETSSDTEIGRRSTATMDAFEGGANGTKSALKVAGEVFPNPQFCLGGSLLSSGASPQDPADLSKKKRISFWAKGDGKTYSIAVQTQTNSGSVPTIQAYVAGSEWKQYFFPISSFDNGHDVTGVAFARTQEAGKFEFRN